MSADISTTSIRWGKLTKGITRIRARVAKDPQVFRSVAALLSGNLMATVLTAVGGLLVARFLGPEITGAFKAYTIPLTYLIFLHAGTWDGLWRQIPYYMGKGMPDKVDSLASAGGAFNLALSCLVSCGLLCCAVYSLEKRNLWGFGGWLAQISYCWQLYYGSYLT